MFARQLHEITGQVDFDFECYLRLLSPSVLLGLKRDKEAMDLLKERFVAKDPTVYQDYNLWLSIIRTNLPYSEYQCFPTKPHKFSFDDFESIHEYGTNPRLKVFADFMKPTHQIEKYQVRKSGERKPCYHEFFITEVRKE